MDISEVNTDKPYKQRFKGVENFLRRVAFNLGNSASQTEVKIISCIPIDVTDLQHRIQYLEKQLQETSKRKKGPKQPRPSATPPPQAQTPPPPMWTSSQPMWQQPPMWQAPPMWGASPMMQPPMMAGMGPPLSPLSTQPGLSMEHPLSMDPHSAQLLQSAQLQQSGLPQLGQLPQSGQLLQSGQPTQSEQKPQPGQVLQSGQLPQSAQLPPCPPCPPISTTPCIYTPPTYDDKDGAVGDKASNPKKGDTVVHTALFKDSYSGQSMAYDYSSDKSSRSLKSRQKPAYSGCCSSKQARKSNVSFVLPATTNNEPHCNFSSHDNGNLDKVDENRLAGERDISLAKKRKRNRVSKKKSKQRTELVYFAQHSQNNPFNKKKHTLMSISHAYLDKVIQKQYDPKFVVQEFSDTSHFSKPICRDKSDKLASLHRSESDVCSCCHGRFQNIDDYMPKRFDSLNKITQYQRCYTSNKYNDSNLYDVVPVKENKNKFPKGSFLPKKDIEIKCWPEPLRYKFRYDPKPVYYHAESNLKQYGKLTARKVTHKGRLDQGNTYQKQISKQDHEKCKDIHNGCSNNYNNDTVPAMKLNTETLKTILLKNVLIETDDLNTKLIRNNQSTQMELIPDEKKTESTLNQIKSILQSVLEEVRTNTTVNDGLERVPKKDAVVQKEASQNNMQGQSTLLHSFTYNHSYNTNPYLPSCSRQVLAGQYCSPGVPYQPSLKYFQNFPVIVHPSGRRLCACYCKNSSHKSSKYKQASSAATNTDKDVQNAKTTKETEKLIKEIYKSMAMTLDFPAKENSVSEYEDSSSTKNNIISNSNKKHIRCDDVEDLGKRDIQVEALISSTLLDNRKLRAISSQSDDSAHYTGYTRNEANHYRVLQGLEQRGTEAIVEDDEETNASSDESEDDIVNVKEYETPTKNERKGILQRMFKSIKMFKKSKPDKMEQNECVEASGASDSDDYETIYSGPQVMPPQIDRTQSYKHKSRPTGQSMDQNALIRSLHGKARRSPYLEQEYRREWNERLIFDKLQERSHSPKRAYSKQSPRETRPPYWNNYEARSTIVEHNLPNAVKHVDLKTKVNNKLKQDLHDKLKDKTAKEKLRWLKKHKLVNCGEQWKKLVLES